MALSHEVSTGTREAGGGRDQSFGPSSTSRVNLWEKALEPPDFYLQVNFLGQALKQHTRDTGQLVPVMTIQQMWATILLFASGWAWGKSLNHSAP